MHIIFTGCRWPLNACNAGKPQVYTETEGEISVPILLDIEGFYPPNQNCQWKITMAAPYQVWLLFSW